MNPSVRRCTLGVATAAAMVLSAASPALAAGPHRTQAKPAQFAVHGVVVSVSGNHVKVLTSSKKVGSKKTRNQAVTLTMTNRTTRHAAAPIRPHRRAAAMRMGADTAQSAAPTSTALTPGMAITATGSVVNGQLVVAQETAAPLPAEALLGLVRVVSADGKTFAVATQDQVNGDVSEHDHGDITIVDASAATFRSGSDTSTATIATPKAGNYVVVLGESNDGDMAAAKVFTFNTAPALVAGTVSASDAAAKTLTVTPSDSSDDNEDGSGSDVTVNASSADVVINGSSGTTGAFPAVGDEVLSVGTAGAQANSLTATLVFGFDQQDNGPTDEQTDNGENNDNQD